MRQDNRKKIILIGAGGHCKVTLDTLLQGKEYDLVGIIDKKNRVGDRVMGIPIIGDDSSFASYFKKGCRYCFISIGSVGNPVLRIRLTERARRAGFKFPNIIHPNAIISEYVKMGEGNYIGAGVIVNSGVKIGDNCILNTGAIIDHDCEIGDFVHIASAAVLSGGVKVGENSHVGTGASVKQYIKIGKNTIIGVGSVVIKDIGDNVVACGNPCKKIK